ncbi:MAG: leader peptide family natural product precursor [Gemmataceae bacterium]|nr:leader peptide family natural product precursor [Gemmataceae bacterium]
MTKQDRFQQKQWGQIVARAWADPEFKTRFLSDPQAVLREHGLEVEAGVEMRVVEDGPGIRHVVLPACPAGELVEEELSPTPGTDSYSGWCGGCGHCGRCHRCGCGCA